jgi:hypothetical protein
MPKTQTTKNRISDATKISERYTSFGYISLASPSARAEGEARETVDRLVG